MEKVIPVRKGKLDPKSSNKLQGLDIDESLGLDQVDEQIRDYLSKKGVRVIELFRQWDDDGTGKIEKAEFRRGMKELGLTVSVKQLDELFDMWDPDKSGVLTIDELQKLLRRGTTVELDAALKDGAGLPMAGAARAGAGRARCGRSCRCRRCSNSGGAGDERRRLQRFRSNK